MKLDIDPAEPPLQALRVQLVDGDGGVLVKRGRVEFRVSGARAAEVLVQILATAADGATRSELCAPFPVPERDAVERLVDALQARRILVGPEAAPPPGPYESEHDVFAWHFGDTTAALAERLACRRIVVLGVNAVAHRLVASLTDGGVDDVEVVDYPLLANLRMVGDDGHPDPASWRVPADPVPYDRWRSGLDPAGGTDPDRPVTLVATTDSGALQVLRWWNEQAVRRGWHYLPVALRDLVGHVGPLVVPGETACYECLRARQNSHLDDAELHRATESHAFEGQAATGFHPSMASVLGDVAALELVKAYSGWQVPRIAGSVVEVNLPAATMTPRRVLRIPRCPACGTRDRRPAVALTRQAYLPGNEVYA